MGLHAPVATPSAWEYHKKHKEARARLDRGRPAHVVVAPPIAAIIDEAEDRSSAPAFCLTSMLAPLDPRMTFDTFVAGRSNTLALAAAKQVVMATPQDRPLFNPLYIHSASGLGKTHLLLAIASAINTCGPRRALYLSAEKFSREFTAAYHTLAPRQFSDFICAFDVLLVDGVHALTDRNGRNTFTRTFDILVDAGRQVVVAGDRAAAELEGLDDRMRSRLGTGLQVELGHLDLEQRRTVITSKVAGIRETHPTFDLGPDVVEYLATTLTSGGRSLEGAVNRLFAKVVLGDETITVDGAAAAISDLVNSIEPKRIMIEEIQRVVARFYGVSRADILSARRTANVVKPRQVAMYLCRMMTLRSLPEIGRRFSNRDHTTALHSVRKISELVANDAEFAVEINHLKSLLEA